MFNDDPHTHAKSLQTMQEVLEISKELAKEGCERDIAKL